MALRVESVSKRFGELEVLRDISLEFRAGRIHALLGANGSGKSTLTKIVCGAIEPTSGFIEYDEKRVRALSSPAAAEAIGIRVVHQESPLIDTLSVLENVAIFRGYGVSGVRPIRWRSLRRSTAALLERMDLDVQLDRQCSTLRPADRAGLALAIAVGDQFDARASESRIRLLLLDEVTAPIPERSAERHLERVRIVADSGISVLMVTHRLGELRFADDVIVLRGGEIAYWENGAPRRSDSELVAEVVGTGAADGAVSAGRSSASGREPVGRLWAAASQGQQQPERPRGGSSPAFALDRLCAEDLDGLSVSADAGEIVGFMGLPQEGLEELPRVLAGLRKIRGGSISVAGRALPRRLSPKTLIDAGIAVVPGDRLREGGVATLSVEENIILPAMGRYWHRRARRHAVVDGVIEAFDVRPPDRSAAFGRLSGGNQQKVLLGKWLALKPSVLVLDDPTHGVDPVARETVFDAIADAAHRGVCVLFFSTEPEQLARLCGRVAVIRAGVVDTELTGSDLSEEALTKWSYQ
jgi:ribose transport system ATP-binding protein